MGVTRLLLHPGTLWHARVHPHPSRVAWVCQEPPPPPALAARPPQHSSPLTRAHRARWPRALASSGLSPCPAERSASITTVERRVRRRPFPKHTRPGAGSDNLLAHAHTRCAIRTLFRTLPVRGCTWCAWASASSFTCVVCTYQGLCKTCLDKAGREPRALCGGACQCAAPSDLGGTARQTDQLAPLNS